ncbi:MAG: response regulator [Armatimonadota bacterium]|nr:response regulator [Armatimonadota bacterium]MDR7485072.1 response regulator [Armatimonadota bacterium]MDR7537039.1 response regulator [Armatimonadota bacterium]
MAIDAQEWQVHDRRRPGMVGAVGPRPGLDAARILIVDDQQANVRLLEAILGQAGYANLVSTTDAREAERLFKAAPPDLVLLDLHMPHLDGIELLQRLRSRMPADGYLPVLVLTADLTRQARERALGLGANDFVIKPFDPTEVLLRIENFLRTRRLHQALARQNEVLEDRVRARTLELEEAQLEILDRLASAAEFRDDATGRHTRRVGALAARLARGLGLTDPFVWLIERTAPLHDVGKLAMPDQILLKPGPLAPAESAIMQRHTTIGARLLRGGRFPLMRMAEEIAHTHHERWDGRGYPRGLAGEVIPLAGRIVAVADAYDAITSDRPYRPARTREDARRLLAEGAGGQWDPAVVQVLLREEPGAGEHGDHA